MKNFREIKIAAITIPTKRARRRQDDVVKQLAASIAEDGMQHPITIHKSPAAGYQLVAGLHRLEAARALGWVDIPALILDGAAMFNAEEIELRENLARAELSPAERTLHFARLKEIAEARHRLKPAGRNSKSTASQVGRGKNKSHTAETLAKVTGRSATAIERDANRAKLIPRLADVIGTSLDAGVEMDDLAKLSDAEQSILIDRAKAGEQVSARRVAERLKRAASTARIAARAEDEQRAVSAIGANVDWRVDECDYRKWNAAHGSVDLIFTDPPYGKEYLDLYRDLPACAERWLKDEGWLAVMCGQSHLPEIMKMLCDGPLNYVWTFAAKSVRACKIHHLGIGSVWKPIILLRKGRPKLREFVQDHIDYVWSEEDSSQLHRWQQAVAPIKKLIRVTTAAGGVVADPFCGSGTTGIAALSMGRAFYGCDVEPASVNTARKRLADTAQLCRTKCLCDAA